MATESLSSWWAGSSHRAVAGAQSEAQRLAIAIGPVRSIIRVIDSHVPAMSVDWAKVGEDDKGRPLSMSFTDFKGGRIAINPLPMMDPKLDIGEAIDIVAGLGLHEASHAEESRDRFAVLVDRVTERVNGKKMIREKPAFEPFRVAVWLMNLVEDVRIEGATGRKWPGTKPYFRKVLDWMWGQRPVEIEDFASSKIEDRMKVVFLACRFPEKVSSVRGVAALVGPQGPRVEALDDDLERRLEIEWWKAWQADYLADRTDVRETIRRGLEHLALDKETKKQMAEMAKEEEQERARGERVRGQLERLMREGIGNLPVCITEDGDVVPLSGDLAKTVDKLLREEFQSMKPMFTDDGNHCAEVRVSRPEENESSRRSYIGRPSALVESLRSALVFRQAAPRWDVKLQKSGDLDDEELWRLPTGDFRVFSEQVVEDRPDVALGLLVDMSGSMAGPHLRTAQRLAQTFLWAIHDDEGVAPVIWGHTGDLDSPGSDIFRLWEPGDQMSRLGLISTLPHGDNYDGFAIAWCVSRMREMAQPQKCLIVLSDGYPAGIDYGDREARRHMRRVVDWAERQGVNVIQIAIDDEIRAQDQEQMFGPGRWVPYVNDGRLLRDLGRVLARWA